MDSVPNGFEIDPAAGAPGDIVLVRADLCADSAVATSQALGTVSLIPEAKTLVGKTTVQSVPPGSYPVLLKYADGQTASALFTVTDGTGAVSSLGFTVIGPKGTGDCYTGGTPMPTSKPTGDWHTGGTSKPTGDWHTVGTRKPTAAWHTGGTPTGAVKAGSGGGIGTNTAELAGGAALFAGAVGGVVALVRRRSAAR